MTGVRKFSFTPHIYFKYAIFVSFHQLVGLGFSLVAYTNLLQSDEGIKHRVYTLNIQLATN